MYRCLILTLLLELVSGSFWILRSTHTNIVPKLTDDVTLHCFSKGPDNVQSVIDLVTEIRLVKRDNDHRWQLYASVDSSTPSQVTLTDPNVTGIVASGHVGQLRDSFLSVTWSASFYDTLGSYKCMVYGLEMDEIHTKRIDTNMVNVINDALSQRELVDTVIKLKQDFTSDIMEQNDFELQRWPSGDYSLLSSAAGCPDSPHSKFSQSRYHVETRTRVPPAHQPAPHQNPDDVLDRKGEANSLTFTFCRSDRKTPFGLWPQGRYCLMWSNTNCPSGFNAGGMRLFFGNDNDSRYPLKVRISDNSWALSLDAKEKAVDFYYCCRDDGDVDTPIILPNTKPFYLYRYKRKCQEVFQTQVQEETLHLDTDDERTDRYLYTGVHQADSSLNDVDVKLCYYSKTMTKP